MMMISTNQTYEYSEQIDAVIYGPCSEWDSYEFLELALAALDQWVKPIDDRGLAVIAHVQALKDDDDEDICGLCGKPGADKIPHPVHWPGEESAGTELVHSECEDYECRRAHAALSQEQREEFLRAI